MLKPFERVVAEHGAMVLRVCRAVVGPADAEDAWADTFLAALQAYPRLDPTSNVRGWLVTIAHRKAIDILRARSRGSESVAVLPERPAPPDGALDCDLRAALAALPPKQRAAVAYHYVAGLPYKEIAVITASTTDAARRAAADGIAALRKHYAAHEGDRT
jgi:RNA polymerase sigma factor (sigma-70 family)